MKYLKTYENLNDSPQVGDYVMGDPYQFKDINNFLSTEIGKIDRINDVELKIDGYPYIVVFDTSIPGSSYGPKDKEMAFNKSELLAWDSSLDGLKLKIKAKKYNL